MVYEVANLLNSTPIGMKPGYNVELGVYLCPNDLLLGYNNMEVSPCVLSNEASVRGRTEFIQSIVSSFWRRWQRDYFPTLLLTQKWHVEKRNIKSGDIVIVKDSNSIRGKWRLTGY